MEKSLSFLAFSKGYTETSIREVSPLALAFLGDSVFELLVRTKLLDRNLNPKRLHIQAIGFVKAKAQAAFMASIVDELTDEELAVYKRGRNANPHTTPKNQTLKDYRDATGLETLFGYLYLLDRAERIAFLFNKIMETREI
ncbi:ribonuclease III [Peptoniphilus equinus]|uniref:Mini-ribonuclease 3 n=1 Tax=Peptoniphilus equinus TaxID=3016343 RepID=A0ABY7QRW8_9FIRM|nr:ribonuclease III domain-containing protein [Peptoniphilus equinus]WBW49534.1 ribonuclease III [Peptoniphilus equinus]